jgi:2-polyprenyl-6-methoxyphenol hydroxylase-like FAD-dependent oxidoreductase
MRTGTLAFARPHQCAPAVPRTSAPAHSLASGTAADGDRSTVRRTHGSDRHDAPRHSTHHVALIRGTHRCAAAPTRRATHRCAADTGPMQIGGGSHAMCTRRRWRYNAPKRAARTNQEHECVTADSLTPALPAECPHRGFYHAPRLLALRLAHADVSERARTSLPRFPCLRQTLALPPRWTRDTTLPIKPATGMRYDKYTR